MKTYRIRILQQREAEVVAENIHKATEIARQSMAAGDILHSIEPIAEHPQKEPPRVA